MTPMGRTNEKKSAKTGDINLTYHIPAATAGDKCRECGGKMHASHFFISLYTN